MDDLLFYEGEDLNKMQTVNDGKYEYNTRMATIFIIITILSFLLFIPFPWR